MPSTIRLALALSLFAGIAGNATLTSAAPPIVAPKSAPPAASGLTFSATSLSTAPVDDGRVCIPDRYKKLGTPMSISVRDRRTEGTPIPTRCYLEIAKYNVEMAKKNGKPFAGAELSMRFYAVKLAEEKLGAATAADRAKLEKALNSAIDYYDRAAAAGAKELASKLRKAVTDAQAQAVDLKQQYEAATGKLKEELHAKQVAAEKAAKSLEKSLAKLDLGYAEQRFAVASKRVGAAADAYKQKAQARLDQAKQSFEAARATRRRDREARDGAEGAAQEARGGDRTGRGHDRRHRGCGRRRGEGARGNPRLSARRRDRNRCARVYPRTMMPAPHNLRSSSTLITTLALLACACQGEQPDEGGLDSLSGPALAELVADPPVAGELAMNVAASAAGTCAKVKAVKIADTSRTCDWDGKSKKPRACEKWSPSISDRCAAENGHTSGMKVDFSFFGQVDCRSSDRDRKVSRIVIHNGDHAANNNENWKCRPSAAHYTVDRDGKIYQHMGEERAAWHANTENDDTIGIEIAIKRKHKGTCNSLPNLEKVAAAEGISPEDVVADMCGPTAAQYKALASLVADIKTRHTIASDGIFGHCEIKATDHGDPKALDWRAIGTSPRKAVNMCKWYHVAAVKATVMSAIKNSAGARVFISAGTGADIEVGDHGYIEDAKENIKTWFTVDMVDAGAASAIVSIPPTEAFGMPATIVATPGKTPKALGSKATGVPAAVVVASKPALGSCELDYTYWKSGTIKSWTARADGTIDTLTFANLGWKHRVCDDSSGMIYVADASDAYVTDGGGKKIRFRMKNVDETVAVAEVFEGVLDVATLGNHRRVVVRVRK